MGAQRIQIPGDVRLAHRLSTRLRPVPWGRGQRFKTGNILREKHENSTSVLRPDVEFLTIVGKKCKEILYMKNIHTIDFTDT